MTLSESLPPCRHRAFLGACILGVVLSAEVAANPSVQSTDAATTDRLHIVYSPPAKTAGAEITAVDTEHLEVVVLPKFDVRDSRILLTDRDVLTGKGVLDLAKKTHLSPLYQATLGPLSYATAIYFNPLLLLSGMRANDPEALVLFGQEERLRRLRESTELIDLIKTTDPKAHLELRRSVQTTFRPEVTHETRRGE